MPVLITGATGMVGRALASRLLAEGGQVRAYIRRDDAALRALGVHVAVGAIENVERLESALTRVHTIVHLVGGWWPERGVTLDFLNRESTECAVIAARAADVRRFIFLSSVGAEPSSENEYLAAKGAAEDHVTHAELEFAIFRLSATAEGLERTARAAARGSSVGLPAGARVNPVALGDVIQAVLAADSRAAEVRGTWELGGPATTTVGEFLAGVGLRASRSPFGRAPRPVADVLARDLVADPADAVKQFSLTLSPVTPAARATAPRTP